MASWRFIIPKPSPRTLELLALAAILLLAAALRFAYPGVNSFAGDEARISLDALRMARGGEFVMAGQPSSVDIPFFPASVWLYALPYALSPDPLVATWLTSLVSLITVAGVWALARRWGAWAGLVAALYMAASPYAVFYGRSIWQPNLLAPLGLAWALAAYIGAARQNRFAIGLTIFLGLFVVQVHFAGIALVPATVYLFLRYRWWRQLIPVLIGAGLAGLAAVPYVYYVTVAHPEILARYGDVLGSGVATIDLQGLENLVRLALGWDWAFLGMGEGDTFSRGLATVIAAGALVGTGLVALGQKFTRLIRQARGSGRGDLTGRPYTTGAAHAEAPANNAYSNITEILLVWLMASALVFLRHSTPVLIHYALIALPALAILGGISTTLLRLRLWKFTVSGVMIVLAAVWSAQIMQTLAYTAVNRPPNSALSSILRESRDAATQPAAPILFFTHGDNPALDGEVAVFKALLWNRPHRIINGDNLLILPPYPATLLATLAPFQAWEEIEAAGLVQAELASDVQTYPRRVGADPFIAARYNGVDEPQGFTLLDEPISFADGTTLIGWKVRWVGPRLRVSTLWQVNADAAPGTYQQFHHLRGSDEGTEPLAISDVALSRETWRAGDRVIVMADFFEIAPGRENLTVDVGHYTLPDLTRVPLLDSAETSIRLTSFTAP